MVSRGWDSGRFSSPKDCLLGRPRWPRSKELAYQYRKHNETWIQSLGQKDPLEKEMATHSSILAWRIPWTEEPDGLQSTGSQGVGHD